MHKLKEKIKNFPDSPGVYRFIGKDKQILYIGRATSLKRRVAQYFRLDLDPRIKEMVEVAIDVKYQSTDTILDSVVLEANLIKKHWPKYNVKDKDNKSFIYIVIAKKDFTYPMLVRQRELGKFPIGSNKIFGPYQSVVLVKNALKILRRLFPYGTCTPAEVLTLSGHKHLIKPCFDYQLGLCPGACVGKISKQDYKSNIDNLMLLLSGQKKRLINKLKRDNPQQVNALNHLQDVTLMSDDKLVVLSGINRIEGYDISHLTGKETYGAMTVMVDGQPDKSQYRLFKIKTAKAGDDLQALSEMIVRRFNHREWPQPDIVLIDGGKPQVDAVAKIMDDMNLTIPMIGISKLAGDKLVYPAKTKKSIKDLMESVKHTLLQVRDEAHRFSGSASRKNRRHRLKIKK